MNVDPRPYNILGICAGVGGLELGVRIANPYARGVLYLEREIAAAARLAARMQDGSLHQAPIWSDLTTFDPEPWRGIVDCITSGDPCQPNSVAGKQLGKDDDRWLLDHILHIIDVIRPARVFRENVPGNIDGQLEALIPALEGMGYRIASGIFSAKEAGASHRRERLFIMADRSHIGHEWSGITRGRGNRTSSEGRSVADDASERRGEAGQHGKRSPQRSGECGALGNTLGSRDGGDAPDQGRRSVGGDAVDGSGYAGVGLADTCRTGSQGKQRELDNQERRSVKNEPIGHGCGAGLLFAPAPNSPAWPEIIRSTPHLAPAVSDADVAQVAILEEAQGVDWTGDEAQAQSVLRRVDARLAQRVDRLRQGGNGVTSLAAAIAWRTLEANLAGR